MTEIESGCIASHHVTLRAITLRHAYWNALIQTTILWMTIAFCWAGFLWLVNGPWLIVGAAIIAALPVPLLIITVQFGLTRLSDGVTRAIGRENVSLD